MRAPGTFIFGRSEFECHLRFSCSREGLERSGSCHISAHTNSYSRSISFLSALHEHMKSVINGSGIQASLGDPEVEKLGGDRYKRIFAVECKMIVRRQQDYEELLNALTEVGFREGLECTL